MFNFENIFLYCMDSNYSYNKMTEVVRYLRYRLESEGDIKELQSEVRILSLVMLVRGHGLKEK